MTPERTPLSCDVMIIGCGLAGMAASLFATQRQLEVAQAGLPGELPFSSGLLDLLAVHPIEEKRLWENPWEALSRLQQDLPDHPYAKMSPDVIKTALNDFIQIIDQAGIAYHSEPATNQIVITAAGTLKPTWAAPQSMLAGVDALEEKQPTLLLDIKGLKGFSARQIVQNLKSHWPELQHATITFPNSSGEIYAETMARSLEAPQIRAALAEAILPHLKGITAVGLPAMLGINNSSKVIGDLEEKLSVRLFEIPTMPPSVTGIRMREALMQATRAQGIATYNQKVKSVKKNAQDFFELTLESNVTISAKSVILAAGRFLGGGLHATRTEVTEPLFNLPVSQPSGRTEWHRKAAFSSDGHPLQTAGIKTDTDFRPIQTDGTPIYENMAVAGTMLAGHQWTRQKCGAGISISSAWVAAKTIADQLATGKG